MSAIRKYEERIAQLATMRHARNPALPGIARLGQLAGKSADDVATDILNNAGTPPLDAREVRRAVETIFASPVVAYVKPERVYQMPSYVPDKVNSCTAGSAELMNLSPRDVRMMTPREQALAYITTVFPDNRHYLFRNCNCYAVRDQSTMIRPMEFYREIGQGGAMPNFVIANMFTGVPLDIENATGDFPPDLSKCRKFANTKTLATFRLALVEFDDMPIKDQCAFWVSVIKAQLAKPRTIVYSGGKSLHALVRLESREYVPRILETEDGFESEEEFERRRSECEDMFREQQRQMEALLGSSDSRCFRMDKACKDPTRLTRMAGAYRADKGKTQKLIYCDWPNEADVPKFFDDELNLFPGYGENDEYMDF